jgi:uncharacterized protein
VITISANVGAVGIGWRHPHYAEVLEGKPNIDFLEVHSENFFAAGGAALAVLKQGRAQYPISLHGVGLALGSAVGIDPWHLDQLVKLVDQIEPVRVSDHACFARGQIAGVDVHAADLLPIPFNDAALNVLCDNVQRVQERLKRQLLVENLSAYISPAGDTLLEPDFLNQLVGRTGCGLLVDVNNIYVNALNAKLAGSTAEPVAACIAWLDRINAHAAGELHLAGHITTEDMVIDDHGSRVCEAVWHIYRHAQARFGNIPALIEWDTNVPPLAVLLDEANLARTALAA